MSLFGIEVADRRRVMAGGVTAANLPHLFSSR
jgi:hypothetical protein